MVNDWIDVFSTHCRSLEVSVLTCQLRWLFALVSWYLDWAGREQWPRSMFCLSTKWETYHLWTKWPPSSPKYKTFTISFSTDGGEQCWSVTLLFIISLWSCSWTSSSSSVSSLPLFFLFLLLLSLLLFLIPPLYPSFSEPIPSSFLYCTDLVQAELATVSHHRQTEMYFSFCNING